MRDEEASGPWTGEPVAPPYESRHRRSPNWLASWWDRLPFLPKIVAITVCLLLLCGGGFGLVGVFTGSPRPGAAPSSDDVASYAEPTPDAPISPAATDATTEAATEAATPTPRPTPVPAEPTNVAPFDQPREPVVETRMVTETESIAFDTRTVRDNNLPKGTRTVRTAGVPGVRTHTYELTFTDGVQTAKELVRSVVTKDPVTEVIAIGTMPEPKCDPNYADACVPIASDVDCAGAGDGPEYVEGPVRVIGEDIYDLDPDGDGVGCDSPPPSAAPFTATGQRTLAVWPSE